MALPAFVSQGAQSTSASATSLAPALPGTRTNNNVMIAFVTVSATGKTFSAGGGWTLFDSINTGNMSGAYFWRLVDGAEAAPTISWTGLAACQAQIFQYSGNDTTTPLGTGNKATANSSTTLTIASLATGAANTKLLALMAASTSQTIAAPSASAGIAPYGNYTNVTNNASANGSTRIVHGDIPDSGDSSDAISVTITSANWVSFGVEVRGTGTSSGSADRATQTVQQVLESYSNANTLRATQTVQQVLESYSNANAIRSTQTVIQVLRTVTSIDVTPRNYGFIII
jgi:hypothetical protein